MVCIWVPLMYCFVGKNYIVLYSILLYYNYVRQNLFFMNGWNVEDDNSVPSLLYPVCSITIRNGIILLLTWYHGSPRVPSSVFLRPLFRQSSHFSCGVLPLLQPLCRYVSYIFSDLSTFILNMCLANLIRIYYVYDISEHFSVLCIDVPFACVYIGSSVN